MTAPRSMSTATKSMSRSALARNVCDLTNATNPPD